MTDEPATPTPRPGSGSIAQFLLTGGVSVLIAHVVGLFSAIANQVLLARLLVPEQLAAYFLTVSMVEVASHLAHLGLPRPVTRLVAQACGRERLDEARAVLAGTVPIWLLASLTVVIAYASGFGAWLARSIFDSEVMASGSVLVGLWIVLQGSTDLLSGALRGFRRVALAAWVSGTLWRAALSVALLVLFLRVGRADFSLIVGVGAGAMALPLIVALAALSPELRRLSTRSRTGAHTLLSAGLPLLLAGMGTMAYERVDLWSAGVLFEAEQVALYGAAKRIIALVSLPIAMLTLVVPPIVAELYGSRDLVRLQRALRGAATLAGLPAFAVLMLLATASGTVLDLVYGEFFREGAVVLSLLCIERFIFVWMGPNGMVLAMTGHETALMRITLVTGVLTVLFVMVGGRVYGFYGLTVGYVIGSACQPIAMSLSVRRLTGLRTDVDLLHVGLALDALRRAVRRRSG